VRPWEELILEEVPNTKRGKYKRKGKTREAAKVEQGKGIDIKIASKKDKEKCQRRTNRKDENKWTEKQTDNRLVVQLILK
jgi:hypothetical protein